jgi:capsular polysaccharide export protein
MSAMRAAPTAVLPPAAPGWPAPLVRGAGGPAADGAETAAALARIRAETLFWPAPRAGARRARALALDAAGLAAALERYAAAEVLAVGRGIGPADVDPDGLEAVFGDAGPAALWAALGGLRDGGGEDPLAVLAAARGVSPWDGRPIPLAEAVEAQAALRRGAMLARGPVRLRGMSAWKRRCLRPFLTGPDGPPRRDRPGLSGPVAVWGAEGGPADLRVEDGFLRSVGLGLRGEPPLSLCFDRGRPHFDARGRTAFEDGVAAADFTPALLARAARLRARVVAMRLTKYNLAGDGGALPDGGGRPRVLAAGQVEDDASIRFGAVGVRRNLDLLAATRARFPDALIVFKPHPDVLAGDRPGAVPEAEALRFADQVAAGAAAEDCLDWCDRVATMTSLMGFEALLRGKAVTCFGRPFYAGWGLTDDAAPPARDRALTLDALVAAALILHPFYVDPRSGLPATPEAALDALARLRAGRTTPRARLARLWRGARSRILHRFGRR